MLDSDTPTDASTDDAQTPAPRRRRAASRPAGPPRAIEPAVEPTPIAPVESEPEAVDAEWADVTPAPAVGEEKTAATTKKAGTKRKRTPKKDTPTDEASSLATVTDTGSTDEAAPAKKKATKKKAEKEKAKATTKDEPATKDVPANRDGDLAVADSTEQSEAGQEPSEVVDRVESVRAAEADADGAEASRPRRHRSSGRTRDAAEDGGSDDGAAALDDLAASLAGKAPEGGSVEEPDEEVSVTDSDGDDDESEGAPRRRRRRRGGRRRRKSADSDAAGEDDESDTEGEPGQDSGESTEARSAAGDGDQEPTSSSGRRRRRRRRRGEDTGADSEDGVDVVVKVREPRRSRSDADQITGIEGSTRMEAKRQRRREGRAAGRRRAPILSEAEFLARRESVERQMLIRQAEEYTQIAVLEDGILAEHYVDRAESASLIGNVYLGRVQNVLPSMEAAFIDIGRGRNAVLYAGEVDWDSYGVTGEDRKVEKVLKSGQSVLVQVTKDPVGNKGARLTAHLSIPGRYVVYCPSGQLSGISRKLPEGERQRLKGILDEAVGSEASVIVRTAAEGTSEEELTRDVTRLKAQWEVIQKKKSGSAPQLLYAEPDLTVRIVRDLFTEDFTSLVVDGNGQGEDSWDTVEAYVTHVAPTLEPKLRRWDRDSEGDIFEVFRVHEQVSKALERKVHLPSGGSLIIDRTEAMTVIDVNTGKFTGSQGNLEATVTSNNLEAAEEIVRQLRLRDIGGIIVIDFIDMVLPANRELLLRRLVECLGRDRTRHQVAEVTSLGLVQMTRKKIGTGLHEAFTVSCETCAGRGYHVHDAPVTGQAPADGGERDGRRGGRNRGGRSRGKSAGKKATQPSSPADSSASGSKSAELATDASGVEATPPA
ncbi:MAG: Rne/Rng family ribonuclease [Propioniciclava sp.]